MLIVAAFLSFFVCVANLKLQYDAKDKELERTKAELKKTKAELKKLRLKDKESTKEVTKLKEEIGMSLLVLVIYTARCIVLIYNVHVHVCRVFEDYFGSRALLN